MKNFFLIILMMALLASTMLISFADSEVFQSKDYSEVENKLLSSGTSELVTQKLIDKLETGELWDSMNPDSKPISIETVILGNDIASYLIYADGSSTTVSLTGGTYSTGTGYALWTGRTVKADSISTIFSYKIDYTLLNGENDLISSVYDKKITIICGTFSQDILQIVKSTENLNGPAQSKLSAKLEYTVPPITGYGSLSVFVGNDTAYPQWNDYDE